MDGTKYVWMGIGKAKLTKLAYPLSPALSNPNERNASRNVLSASRPSAARRTMYGQKGKEGRDGCLTWPAWECIHGGKGGCRLGWRC